MGVMCRIRYAMFQLRPRGAFQATENGGTVAGASVRHVVHRETVVINRLGDQVNQG